MAQTAAYGIPLLIFKTAAQLGAHENPSRAKERGSLFRHRCGGQGRTDLAIETFSHPEIVGLEPLKVRAVVA